MASNENQPEPGLKERAQAFTAAVFGQHQRHLHRYLMRRLRSDQDAKDLAQEVYLRLLRVEDTSHIAEPLAYAYRTAANVVTEFQMRRRRERVQFDTGAVEHHSEHPPEPPRDEIADQLSTERAFERALLQLPPVHRVVLLLRLRDGLSFDEIAAQLTLSTHTVRKYFFRSVGLVRTANWE